MTTFDDIMSAITTESKSAETTDQMYAEAKTQFGELEKAYFKLRGLKFDGGVKGLFQQLLPRLLTRMGITGGIGIGALLTGMSANEGGFSEILGSIPILGGLLGALSGG